MKIGQVRLLLHDRTAAMEDLTPDDVDIKDLQQVGVWKTYQILTNQVIYAESYLRI